MCSRTCANTWIVLPGAGSYLVTAEAPSAGRAGGFPTVDEVASVAESRGFRVADRMAITVTREDVLHSRNAITKNVILELAAD